MDIHRDLRIFIKAAELLSFSKAADALNITKSAVSANIQNLEYRLGTNLFIRTTRKINLTNDGEMLYLRAQNLIGEIEDFTNIFRNKNIINGVLRIDMPIAMANNFIIPNLHNFYEIYPNITIELSSTDRKINIQEDGFDVIIRAGDIDGNAKNIIPLGSQSLGNYIGKNYFEKYGAPKDLIDLKNHRLIDYALSFPSKMPVFEYCENGIDKAIQMQSSLSVNNSISYLSACLEGYGIIQTPLIGAKKYIENGTLISILKDYQARAMPINLIIPQENFIPRRTKIFIDWLKEIIPNYN